MAGWLIGVRQAPRGHPSQRPPLPGVLSDGASLSLALFFAAGLDTEYQLARSPTTSEYDRPQAWRGEIVVQSDAETVDEHGYVTRKQVHVRGTPVASGTFAALSAKATPKPKPLPLKAWDRIAMLVSTKEPTRIATGPSVEAPDPLLSRLYGQMREMLGSGERELIEVGGVEALPRGGAALLAHLRGHGLEISLAPRTGRLLVPSRRVIGVADRELLEVGAPLLVTALGGEPAICDVCTEPATSVAFPRALLCERHLRAD